MRNRAATALVLCGVLAGCSFTPEDAAEPIAERAIENRLEDATGEAVDDLDLQLDNDDGSISIGGTRDGEDFSVSIDPETGEIVVSKGDKERTAQVDIESGSVSVDGNEIDIGELESSSAEISDWPDDVPLPGGEVLDVARSQNSDQSFLTLSINPGNDAESIFGSYLDALGDAGFDEIATSTSSENGFATYDAQLTRGATTILIDIVSGDSAKLGTISLVDPL